MMRSFCRFVVPCGLIALLSACGRTEYKVIEKPLEIAASEEQEAKGQKTVVVPIDQLARGEEQYVLYCRPCHGVNGDGRGPAGIGLVPPPRNFASENLTFKFGGVEAGSLPPDEELLRIVKHGLDGTAMLKWDIPEPALRDIIA